ncbi:MAG TPA: glycosyltransferase [Chitinophagaceae bacterium]|nr:glycosyltransferase [Chitinophagaceae bacterium]
MPASNPIAPNTISVIIPCYNHGAYLAEAIESVLQQTVPAYEILVIDDGSTDNTKAIACGFEKVTYHYQTNQGLSAARNAGIKKATGKYIIFADADDWLLPDAFETALQCLNQNNEAAFASGGHKKVTTAGTILEEENWAVEKDHYRHLLEGNYIGMHGTVLYRAWAFEKVQYDTSLKACEDYDVYLKLARLHPVLHHTKTIAAYRIHTQNMSGDIALMLQTVLQVLERQRPLLQTDAERASFVTGQKVWKEYYTKQLFQKLIATVAKPETPLRRKEVAALLKYSKSLYIKYLKRTTKMKTKALIKKSIPPVVAQWLYKKGLYKSFIPAPGHINLGSLNRTKPFSTAFGYDRGGPVDRYYIENFLEKNSALVKGRVLEIGDNEYTLRFGGANITQSDILHIDDSNKQATFIGDLSNAPQLPDASFDCIVLTQTLHLIYDYKDALRTCYRILKPGGALLLTVPGISHIDQGEWKNIWLWSFTEASVKKLLAETFSNAHIDIETFGNVLVATAFLYGMGLPELEKAQLDATDPHYQVIITACAVKPVHA